MRSKVANATHFGVVRKQSDSSRHHASDVKMLEALQRDAFGYFLHETNPANGLVIDKTREGWPASIAAVGLALAAYPVGVERAILTREEAVKRTLTTLRFFSQSSQGPEPDTSGYKGFYYHFLQMKTGERAWKCELSTVDTALFLAGALTAAVYFDRHAPDEREIRTLADTLYARADWQWAQNGGATVTHGWKPESGFLPYRWEGYDEALILYLLGLGSPTYPLPAESYTAWASTYQWKNIYDSELLYAGPLNEGPNIMMIENDCSGLVWQLMRQCPYIVRGLRRAGFTNGWLSEGSPVPTPVASPDRRMS